MGIGYARDVARKRVMITFDGAVEAEHISATIDRLTTENAWGYARLYDLRMHSGSSGMAALQYLLSYLPRNIPPSRRCGPIAIVAHAPDAYTKACALASLADRSLVIEVFHDKEEADQWLVDVTKPWDS